MDTDRYSSSWGWTDAYRQTSRRSLLRAPRSVDVPQANEHSLAPISWFLNTTRQHKEPERLGEKAHLRDEAGEEPEPENILLC